MVAFGFPSTFTVAGTAVVTVKAALVYFARSEILRIQIDIKSTAIAFTTDARHYTKILGGVGNSTP